MHYYEHNIADYRKDTMVLSLLEHGIYRQMLDTYYLDEQPLTLDDAKLMRSHCIRSADEMQAFKNVLQDYFVRTDDGYIHTRCDKVITAYHGKSSKARDSANARWAKGSSERNANALPTQSEGNANHKPLTINHKPITKESKRATRLAPDWLPSDEDVLYCQTHRPELDHKNVAENFRDYWIAKSGAQAAKMDWPATWRSWVRKETAPRQANKPYVTAADKTKAFADRLTGNHRNDNDNRTIDITPTDPCILGGAIIR